jgi:hypothetical protein
MLFGATSGYTMGTRPAGLIAGAQIGVPPLSLYAVRITLRPELREAKAEIQGHVGICYGPEVKKSLKTHIGISPSGSLQKQNLSWTATKRG